MTTVIEIWGLFKSGMYADKETPAEGFGRVVSAIFCSDDVLIEENLDETSGKVPYDVDYLVTVNHDGVFGNISFKDVAFILSIFCKSLRIKNDKGEELVYFTDVN